jgi:predicted ATPase/DNA-binding SARP family transcriptional activator
MGKAVRIRLFGAFAVRVGDEDVPEAAWRLRKARSLVKLLALAPERRIHRERATELLWPDRAPEAAANNFHQALYVARRALEAAGAEAAAVLPLRDDMLALHPGGTVEVDVDAFEAAAARARETGALPDCQAALGLYGGELLPEDRYEPWAAGRREALSEAYLGLLLELSARLAERGDTAAAVEALEQVVVADPLHEAAHRALMRLFAAGGRRQQALAQYHQLRTALRRELEAEPDPQTAELYRELLRGEPGATAPGPGAAAEPEPVLAPPAAVAPHNLPVALTSFVGRGRELREVGHLLDRNRLVTLVGAGGAGKTRLALEAATARLPACPDGVWLVELAGLGDPALVPAATASALGLTLPSQRPPLEGLSAQLAGSRALLVVDNCEHLVAACALLAEHLLAACPDLRILATSREPLRVPGEVTWRVPSLALPDSAEPAQLASCESIRLFCVRARDVAPAFALGADNAAAVAEICLRLDGMPLALELAAARVGALSPQQIAERLGDCLAVLTAGRRSALDRQQTLRATLSWSHDLLTSAERTLFRRLAVFAGSFSLEGAEAVAAGASAAGGEAVAARDVADLLGRLVDKSLVVPEEEAGGYRYRLLEPMRQYARERLDEAGEATAPRARHLAFYLELAAAADPEGPAAAPAVAPRRLEPDHDNLRAALGWALRHEPQQALRLAVRMWPMWMASGRFQEGSRWLEAALAAAPQPTALRAEALRAAGGLEVRLGRPGVLSELGAERVAIFRALGDRRALAHALDEAGVYEYMVSRNDRAEELYAQSRALAEELSDGKVAAAVVHSVGVLAHCRGDFAAAREALLDSLTLLRELPAEDRDPFFRVHTAGLFVAPEGPGAAPRMYFEETVQFFRRVDARGAVGYVLAALGDVARAQGLRQPARERLAESLAHFREAGDAMGTAFALNRLGSLAGAMGEHDLGRELLDEALALRRDLGDRRAAGMTLGNLGVLSGRAGDLERAQSVIGEALALFEATDDAPGQAGMRLNLGTLTADAAADAAAADRARELLEAARRRAEAQLLLRCAGWTTLRLAELAIAGGEPDRAAGLLDAALAHLRPLGDRWGVARALELDRAAAKGSLSPARER